LPFERQEHHVTAKRKKTQKRKIKTKDLPVKKDVKGGFNPQPDPPSPRS
jgi:hypothetical protein